MNPIIKKMRKKIIDWIASFFSRNNKSNDDIPTADAVRCTCCRNHVDSEMFKERSTMLEMKPARKEYVIVDRGKKENKRLRSVLDHYKHKVDTLRGVVESVKESNTKLKENIACAEEDEHKKYLKREKILNDEIRKLEDALIAHHTKTRRKSEKWLAERENLIFEHENKVADLEHEIERRDREWKTESERVVNDLLRKLEEKT
jgi:hypothetical protein